MINNLKTHAFTLAETLITLVVIGTIAAMTIPALNNHIGQKESQSQAKKAMSVLNQTLDKTKLKMGYTPKCYYWDSNTPYSALACKEKDEFGSCKNYTLSDGSPLPADVNGPYTDCPKFFAAFFEEMNVIKVCKGGAYRDGCIAEMKGIDTILKSNGSGVSDEEAASKTGGCGNFRESSVRNNLYAYVLADGMILMPYSLSNYPIMLVDVNGKKGPNKWGYDIMTFTIKGSPQNDTYFYGVSSCMQIEKGGKTTQQIIAGS